MSVFRILDKAQRQLKEFPQKEQRAFTRALERFASATPLARRQMLKFIGNSAFDHLKVKWSLRASRKQRVLLDWDQNEYVIRGFVTRGDHRYYDRER